MDVNGQDFDLFNLVDEVLDSIDAPPVGRNEQHFSEEKTRLLSEDSTVSEKNVGQHQNVVKSGSSEILVDEKAKMKMLPDDGYLVVTSSRKDGEEESETAARINGCWHFEGKKQLISSNFHLNCSPPGATPSGPLGNDASLLSNENEVDGASVQVMSYHQGYCHAQPIDQDVFLFTNNNDVNKEDGVEESEMKTNRSPRARNPDNNNAIIEVVTSSASEDSRGRKTEVMAMAEKANRKRGQPPKQQVEAAHDVKKSRQNSNSNDDKFLVNDEDVVRQMLAVNVDDISKLLTSETEHQNHHSPDSGIDDLMSLPPKSPPKFQIEPDSDGEQWFFCKETGCPFWTSKPERMERHRKCHDHPVSAFEIKKTYKCPDCSMKFYSLAKLLKHDRKKHTGVKEYECRICSAEVTDIQVHMRVHADVKVHSCQFCSLEFRHKSSLVRHLYLHTGERPYRCQGCEASFTARDKLKSHILKHHPNHPAAAELKAMCQQQQQKPEVSKPKTRGGRPESTSKPETLPSTSTSGHVTLEFGDLNEGASMSSAATPFIFQWPQQTFHISTTSDGSLVATLQNGNSSEVENGGKPGNPVVSYMQVHPNNEEDSINRLSPSTSFDNDSTRKQKEGVLDVAMQEIADCVTLDVPIIQLGQNEETKGNLANGGEAAALKFANKTAAAKPHRENKKANGLPQDSNLNSRPKLFACEKCGRAYKYESFLKVHQESRKC